jgi:alkylhydroperoxidase family enzyme
VESHGHFLQLQGTEDEVVNALAVGDLDKAPLTDAERELMRFTGIVTQHAYRTTDEDVERLRSVGWSDPQIAEAVYIIALFAFFNRVADAFGIGSPGYREMPAFPEEPSEQT